MFQQFYGLENDPFSLSPDLEFLFHSRAHEEAVAHMLYGLEQKEGITLILGDIGCGKTLALHRLLDKISDRFIPVSLTVTNLEFGELLDLVLLKLGLAVPPGTGVSGRLFALENLLVQSQRNGKRVLIVVDEAQNLKTEALESLRMLMNLAQPGPMALQLIISGQLGLKKTIDSPGLRQLRQRIRVEYVFEYLNREEMDEYIEHRLAKVGRTEKLFEDDALDRIYKISRGVPRLVNYAASKALLEGFVADASRIKAKYVKAEENRDLLAPESKTPAAPLEAAQPAETAAPVVPPEPVAPPIPIAPPEPVALPEPVAPPETNLGAVLDDRPEPRPAGRENRERPRHRGRSSVFKTMGWMAAALLLAVLAVWGWPRISTWFSRAEARLDRAEVTAPQTEPVVLADAGPSAEQTVDPSEGTGDPAEEMIEPAAENADPTEGPAGLSGGTDTAKQLPAAASDSVASTVTLPPAAAGGTDSDDGMEKPVVRGERFVVHVASFMERPRAEMFLRTLNENGSAAFIREKPANNGRLWYRVLLGPFQTMADARGRAALLDDQGVINYSKLMRN